MDKGKKSIFSRIWPFGKKPEQPKKAEYESVDADIDNLALKVKDKYDVVIAGDVHALQSAQSVKKQIFEKVDPELPLFEASPSIYKKIAEKNFDYKLSTGVVNEALQYAVGKALPVKVIDVEICENPTNVRLLTTLTQHESGAVKQMEIAYSLSNSYLALHGRPEAAEFLSESKNKKEEVKSYLQQFGKDLPKFHHDNLKEAAADFDRAGKGDFITKIANYIDNRDDSKQITRDIKNRLADGDKIMAANAHSELLKIRKDNPEAQAFIANGASHNDGLREELEKKGLSVASIKIFNHDNTNLHGRVFQRVGVDGQTVSDWIVSVNEEVRRAEYEPEAFRRAREQADALRATPLEEPKEVKLEAKPQPTGIAPNLILPAISKSEIEL